MFVDKYPYSDLHELNLDWIISKIKELDKNISEFEALNKITWRGEWSIEKAYPRWSLVEDAGDGYISLQPVPKGVELDNEAYWVKVADYSALYAAFESRISQLENEFLTLSNKISKHYLNIKKCYVDGVNGDDSADGEHDKPFKTLNRAMNLLNEGFNNLSIVFLSSGTYFLEQRNMSGCALHLSTENNADVIIKSHDLDSWVIYATHVNFGGTEDHPMIFDIPTLRFDNAQIWAVHCRFIYGFSGNGCGSRFENCIFDEYFYHNMSNVQLINPTVKNSSNGEYCFSFISSIAFISGYINISDPSVALSNNSKVVLAQGSYVGIHQVTTNTLTNKYNWFARCYGGSVCATNATKNILIPALSETSILNSGDIWVNP